MSEPQIRLDVRTRIARTLLQSWPFSRGRWRLQQFLEPFMTIPESGSFSFDFGTFVDTPLSPWPNGYRELFLHGCMERNELEVWKRLVRPGDAVVDGGANYGYWTLVASRLVGTTGKVFAFEANPVTASRLKTNIAASERHNIKPYPYALGSEDGVTEIHVAADNAIAGHASLHRHEGWKWSDAKTVMMASMDEVAKKDLWPPLRLVKLDIEGAELAALKGMQRILREDQPFLTVEWNATAAAGFGYHPMEIVAYLKSLGFCLVRPTASGFTAAVEPDQKDVTMMWFVYGTADAGD